MATLGSNKILTSQFFEFAAGESFFELIDIVAAPQKNQPLLFNSLDGFFKYKSSFIIDKQKIRLYDIKGFSFSICKNDPRISKDTKSSNVIEKFEMNWDENDNSLMNASVNRILSEISHEDSANQHLPIVNVIAAHAGGEFDLPDPIVIPNTLTSQNVPDFKSTSKMLKILGHDPARLAAVGNFSTVSPSNALSLDQKNTFVKTFQQTKQAGRYSHTEISVASLRNTLRSSRRGNQDNPLVRIKDTPADSGKQINASRFDLIPTKSLMHQIFQFSMKDLFGYSKVFILIEPIVSKKNSNNIFTPIVTVLNHRKNVEKFLINPEPPNVSIIETSYSKVSFMIERVDPTLREVLVTRIIQNSVTGENSLNDIQKISFSQNDTVQLTDTIDNVRPNQFIYRFSVINEDGSIGEFTSINVNSYKKPMDTIKSDGIPISIRATNSTDGINIKVYSLSNDVFSIRLLRQEIGKIGEFSDSIVQINDIENNSITLVDGKKSEFDFIDYNAILGKKYRYFLAMRKGTGGLASLGEEVLSDEDEVIIRRQHFGEIPFSISVTNPTITDAESNDPTVDMTINAVETTELFNTVTSALRAAGVANEFISQLQADNIKSKLFVTFLVERFDVETGKRVSFGLVPAGNFSDSPNKRKELQIPAPISGHRYCYIVKTCLQSPLVFLQTSKVGVVSRTGKSFDKQAIRFARQMYTNMGIMPAEHDMEAGVSIESLALESQVGLEIVKDVTFNNYGFQIEDLKVSRGYNCNNIVWRVSGDSKKINYFLIYCTVNGEENLLGSISSSKNSSYYVYNDERYFDEVGTKSYRVAAVNFEDEETASSPTSKTVKLFSVPENLINGNVLATFNSKQKVLPADHIMNTFAKVVSKNEDFANMGKQLEGFSTKLVNNISSLKGAIENVPVLNNNMPSFGGNSQQRFIPGKNKHQSPTGDMKVSTEGQKKSGNAEKANLNRTSSPADAMASESSTSCASKF